MRQGETAPKGAWIGNPQGGVTAPLPLILPDPSKRFAVAANRLEELAAGHPIAPWLLFMARLLRATRRRDGAGALAPPEQSVVRQAVEARMPPLAADGHRRAPTWRDGLLILLDSFDDQDLPAEASTVVADLRQRDAGALETLADNVLAGALASSEAGAALYVVAALQVYFTLLAAALHAPSLRLLEQRGLCPCCGSTPVSGLVTASDRTPGARYLYCSLCSTAWNHVRAVCITCSDARSLSLRGIDGDFGAVKAETCGECRTYSKLLYQTRDMRIDPFADDLASLGLDLLVAEAGFARHAPNPLLLIDQGRDER